MQSSRCVCNLREMPKGGFHLHESGARPLQSHAPKVGLSAMCEVEVGVLLCSSLGVHQCGVHQCVHRHCGL